MAAVFANKALSDVGRWRGTLQHFSTSSYVSFISKVYF